MVIKKISILLLTTAVCRCFSVEVPQWHITEIDFTAHQRYTNPYADVTVAATFIGPQGERIEREAFWRGGSRWTVRFAPTAAGEWHWRTICSSESDGGLHARAGSLQCVSYNGTLPLYRHGFLRVSDNSRYFCHADGTPFFWLADTHWQMPDTERVDLCNHPEHPDGSCPFGGQFQHLAHNRKILGFTVYQTYPHVENPHWWIKRFSQIDPARFEAVFDIQMNYLAAEGYVIALGLGHFASSTRIPAADLRRWARYLVARYGTHPVVWITGQEINAPEERGRNRCEVWNAVAKEIALCNSYRQPHSGHQWVVDVDVRPLGNKSWHTWFALQGGHRNSGLTPQSRYAGYYNFRPVKPVLETEAMYEGIHCGGVVTTGETRRSAWKAMLCGCAGYTYGAAGVWALKWNDADTRWKSYNQAISSWHAGMKLPGVAQMRVMKEFFVALPWTKLTPRFNNAAWARWEDNERCVLATLDNQLYVAYCYGATACGTLFNMKKNASYEARWFDPRTGRWTATITEPVTEKGEFKVPEKPDANDWVLLVRTQ
jgi:hypothetical protein